jgi:uncharacterized lipoprotein YmbA
MTKSIIVTLGLFLLLPGCGVTPSTNYYVLDSNTQVAPTHESLVSVGVGPVTVANYLDRAQITLKQDNTLNVDEFNRWGEPLTAGITRVLMVELATQLDSGNLVQFPWRSDQTPDLRVKLAVLELNRDNHQASLKAGWTITTTQGGEKLQEGVEILRTPIPDDSYAALVAGYSQLLEQLAARIGSAIYSSSEYYLRRNAEKKID